MSITLNLDPEVEKCLKLLAQERGLSLTDYILEVLYREAARAKMPTSERAPERKGVRMSGEEEALAFLEWADSFPDVPLLSDEAISRDSLYPVAHHLDDHHKEHNWVSRHRSAFLGQWVALDGETLLASGRTAIEVYEAARATGVAAPYVVLVAAEEAIPFAGW